jgi:DNA-binding transcriptional ArsR family regulator
LTGKSLLAYRRRVADVFKALADSTRRTIVDELSERSPQTLFELCSRLAMRHGITSTRQAISQHLDVLESAGLVTTRREGRCKLHAFDPTPLHAIVERWLDPTRLEDACASPSPPSSSRTRSRPSASTPASSAS